MKPNKRESERKKPVVRTTSSGGRYVRPSDIIRSTSGRAIIKSHASPASKTRVQMVNNTEDSTIAT